MALKLATCAYLSARCSKPIFPVQISICNDCDATATGTASAAAASAWIPESIAMEEAIDVAIVASGGIAAPSVNYHKYIYSNFHPIYKHVFISSTSNHIYIP